VYDNRNFLQPESAIFHIMFMREHNRVVDLIRRQADCNTADVYYIGAFGTPDQKYDATCEKKFINPDSPRVYKPPQSGLWSGDDMYRLARLLVGVAIQSIASDWADHFFGPDRANPYAGNYPYNINSDARINHGLTLESAVLFNLPTYQPPGFNQRGLRLNQTQCNLPNVPHGNDVDYLDTYVRDHLLYLTGQSEALINMHNGVYNSNRGSNDIISILIRRGRELGVPSFTAIRDAIAVSVPAKPLCAWNTWTDTADCNATALFKHSAYATLKSLYRTPGDVELVVGAALSNDLPLNAEGIPTTLDATQAWLVLGEIDRIVHLDVFGIFQAGGPAHDSFFDRLVKDDPDDSFSGWTRQFFSHQFTRPLTDLIQDNTGLLCVQTDPWRKAGFDVLVESQDPNQENTFNLKFIPTSELGQRANCDITTPQKDSFTFEGLDYVDVYCNGDPNFCFRPALPWCV